MYAQINGKILNKFYHNRSLFPNKDKVYFIFMANTSRNTLCVYSTETWLTVTPQSGCATFVDNF